MRGLFGNYDVERLMKITENSDEPVRGTSGAGKGDGCRIGNWKAFRDNMDEINWEKKDGKVGD